MTKYKPVTIRLHLKEKYLKKNRLLRTPYVVIYFVFLNHK